MDDKDKWVKEMICRECLKGIIREYFSVDDENKMERMTKVIAREIELVAYDMIRQLLISEKFKRD